jgi:hypothetical protein
MSNNASDINDEKNLGWIWKPILMQNLKYKIKFKQSSI